VFDRSGEQAASKQATHYYCGEARSGSQRYLSRCTKAKIAVGGYNAMSHLNAFQIYGPFEVEKPEKIYDNDYRNAFWEACDNQYPHLSEAKGVYLFSLRNATNYTPAYVGMTCDQIFCQEVFSAKNKVMILGPLSYERGVLCLHLLAKPNDANGGFSKDISEKTLLWTETFLIQLCHRKNPDLQNSMGSQFIKTTAIANITDNFRAKGPPAEPTRTFRNAIGIDDV
jgi:hypothetical protein